MSSVLLVRQVLNGGGSSGRVLAIRHDGVESGEPWSGVVIALEFEAFAASFGDILLRVAGASAVNRQIAADVFDAFDEVADGASTDVGRGPKAVAFDEDIVKPQVEVDLRVADLRVVAHFGPELPFGQKTRRRSA